MEKKDAGCLSWHHETHTPRRWRETAGELDQKQWVINRRVDVSAGHVGIVATGSTKRGSGYTSVRAACLVAPPNP